MATATAGRQPGQAQVSAPPMTPARPLRFYIDRLIRYVVMILVGLILFTPFILAFLGSFKTDAEILAYPPKFLPSVWQMGNWPKLWNTDFGQNPDPSHAMTIALAAGLTLFLVVFITLAMTGYAQKRWDLFIIGSIVSLVGAGLVTYGLYALQLLVGGGRFPRWLVNTAILALIVAVLEVILCSLAAYAFARMRFPGKDAIFSFMLATMMIPSAVTLIPGYVLMSVLGWVNTAWALVVPGAVSAFGIFMLTQFFKAIPHELEEAAFIDGAGFFQIYRDVLLPLARPALLTLFILQFQGMWNNFLTALLYMSTPDMWTLNVGLSTFQQQYKAAWNITLVGAMINALPILVMFFIFSRYYIEGVSYAGVKG